MFYMSTQSNIKDHHNKYNNNEKSWNIAEWPKFDTETQMTWSCWENGFCRLASVQLLNAGFLQFAKKNRQAQTLLMFSLWEDAEDFIMFLHRLRHILPNDFHSEQVFAPQISRQPCSFMMLVLAGRWQVTHDQEETEQFLPHTFGFINAQTETTDEMGPFCVQGHSPKPISVPRRDPITTNIYCSLIVLPLVLTAG